MNLKKLFNTKSTLILGSFLTFNGIGATLLINQLVGHKLNKKHIQKLTKKSHWASKPLNLNLETKVQFLGQAGLTHISNLFFVGSKFLVNSKTLDLSQPPYITHLASNYSHPLEILSPEQINSEKRSKKVYGTTIVFQASEGMRAIQNHYFHFCEEFLAALAVQNHFNLGEVQTVIFPARSDWKGPYHDINEKLIHGIFPNADIYGKKELEDIASRFNLQFENVIFIDREACHRVENNQYFNKMLFASKDLIPKSVIQHFKCSIHKSLKTYDQLQRKPYMTYIKRSKRRFVDPGYENKLLKELAQKFPQYTLKEVFLEKLSFPEQLQLIRNTKVLIGAHGNGLTHQLFLPNNSLVIELFPEKAYAMDYQLLSELSGHSYYAFSPNQGMISQTGNYMPMQGNLNEVINALDTESIVNVIQEFNSGETLASKETSLEP